MEIMTIFDLLIFVVGIYMVIAALKMQRTGVISTVLITDEESSNCVDKEGFIRDMYWREAVLGAVMVILGVVGLLNKRIFFLDAWGIVEMLIFLASFLWFQRGLNQARKKFF